MSDRVLLRDLFGVCTVIVIADGEVNEAETNGLPAIVSELGGVELGPADVAALTGEMYADIGRAGSTHAYLQEMSKRHDVVEKHVLLRAASRAMRLDGSVDPRELGRLREVAAMFGVDPEEIEGT